MVETRTRSIRLVDTYERFHAHIAAWIAGEIDPLLVVGPGGFGKSFAYQTALAKRPHLLFRGRTSPIRAYIELSGQPTVPVVLDDIAALLHDSSFRDLLKNLLESGKRVIRWNTATPKLQGIPMSFVFTGPVLLVMNRIPARDPDLEAILDRCDAIRFEPTKPEVIARMRELFPGDGELIDLLADLPTLPSLRTLVKARRWSRSNHVNLVEELTAECGVPEAVAVLTEIMATTPEEQWVELYVARTGLTDRTFRRHRRVAVQLLACRKSLAACPDVRKDDRPVPGEAPHDHPTN